LTLNEFFSDCQLDGSRYDMTIRVKKELFAASGLKSGQTHWWQTARSEWPVLASLGCLLLQSVTPVPDCQTIDVPADIGHYPTQP
jgi:hypothetical protein